MFNQFFMVQKYKYGYECNDKSMNGCEKKL